MTEAIRRGYSFDLRALDAQDLDRCFAMASRVFAKQSTLHQALDIDLDAYRAYLWPSFRDMVGEGLSVVAVGAFDGRIKGCLIVTAFDPDPSPHPVGPLAPMTALTAELVVRYGRRRRLSHADAVLVDMGAVESAASGQVVYQAMRAYVNATARARGYRFILGELSSAATQHVVLDRMGHRRMADVPFATFEFNGIRPFAAITEPPSLVMSEGDLNTPDICIRAQGGC